MDIMQLKILRRRLFAAAYCCPVKPPCGNDNVLSASIHKKNTAQAVYVRMFSRGGLG